MTIKNTLISAERYYDAFINQSNDWSFFLGLAEYVKFLVEDENAGEIIYETLKQKQTQEEMVAALAKKAIIEINDQAEKIFKIIKNNKFDFNGLEVEIKEYQDWRNGLTYCSQPLPSMLFENLADIIQILLNNNRVEEIKNFAILKSQPNIIISDEGKQIVSGMRHYIKSFTFSKNFLEYEKAKKLFDNKRDVEIWGVWEDLLMVYQAVYKSEECVSELKDNEKKTMGVLGAMAAVSEMKKIKSGEGGSGANGGYIFFKRQNFIGTASRLHNYLFKELNKGAIEKEGVENEKIVVIRSIKLSEQKCLLEINDGEYGVPFRSKKGRSGLEKETKLFKIFLHFWEFRREIGKNNNVIRKGDWVILKNLAIQAGSKEGATYKLIERAAEKVKKFPIEIENDNAGKYRLVVKMN